MNTGFGAEEKQKEAHLDSWLSTVEKQRLHSPELIIPPASLELDA